MIDGRGTSPAATSVQRELGLHTKDPYPGYQWLRHNQPVWWSDAAQAWVVTRYADVSTISKDVHTYHTIPDTGRDRFLASTHAPHHMPQRRVYTGSGMFSSRSIEMRVQPAIIAKDAVSALPATARFDAVRDLAVPVVSRMMAAFFELKSFEVEQLDWVEIYTGATPDGDESKPETVAQVAFVRELIARRAQGSGTDPISRFIRANETSGVVTQEAMVWTVWGMLMGSTRAVIDQVVLCLDEVARAPHFQGPEYLTDPAAVRKSVEELVRFRPAVHCLGRIAQEDTVLNGVAISAGDCLYMVHASANRDEDVWPDAERLDLRREPKPNFAFGLSVHQTPAATFVKIIVGAVLQALMNRFARVEPVGELEFDVQVRRGESIYTEGEGVVTLINPSRLDLAV